jgi:chromosome segregation ATPase
VELALIAKDRDIESAAESHAVESRVYQQKVKHLEYEHTHTMTKVAAAEAQVIRQEEDEHLRKEAALRAEKGALRTRTAELEAANAESVAIMKSSHEKVLSKLRSEFAEGLEQLRLKYEGRLQSSRAELQLRHKVETHEVEERKNLHINQLMIAHDAAFSEMRSYYNSVTKANLELISQLKQQIAEAAEKQGANQRLMMEIAEENKRLSEPLARTQLELVSLKADLKDLDKDRLSLRYARGRLRAMRDELTAADQRHAAMEADYAQLAREREQLQEKFTATVQLAHSFAESKAAALEQRLVAAEADYTARQLQVREVLAQAQLDPSVLLSVNEKLDSILEGRTSMAREAKRAIAALVKAHNDAVRVLSSKLRDMGISAAEAQHPLLPAAAGGIAAAPAGLVSRPPTMGAAGR